MATNLKKIILLVSLIAAFSILAIEMIPLKTESSTISISETNYSKRDGSDKIEISESHSYADSNEKENLSGKGKADATQSELDKNTDINQCTLVAIKSSELESKSKRELSNFIKAFEKKEFNKLVQFRIKMQRVLYTEKGREKYYEFYNTIANLYHKESALFCSDDPITLFLQFIESLIDKRKSLEFEEIDFIISSNIELISNFSVLEYFILIFSVDIKYGEELTLALIQKLNINSLLQHQPLPMYSGIYWMLFHSFNTLSEKSKEIVWRKNQLQFVAERFSKVKELPENRTAQKRLIVFMIVASYQFNSSQFSVSHFFDKIKNQSLSMKEQEEAMMELANTWLDAVMSIRTRWLTKNQVNEVLLQYVDFARGFSSDGEHSSQKVIDDKKTQQELLWLVAERGQGESESAVLLAIELLKKRAPDSERLSRYLVGRAEELGLDELFLDQIEHLISLYPDDYELNTRRYSYQKKAELLSLTDINQYLQFLETRKGTEDEEMNKLLSRQELSLMQERADYYLNTKQYGLAEVDWVQIYERSPDLENLTELGAVYNLNNKPEYFIALFESQISLFGMHPDELAGEYFDQDYDDDFLGFLLSVYSVYADSLEGVGDSEKSKVVQSLIKRINGGSD